MISLALLYLGRQGPETKPRYDHRGVKKQYQVLTEFFPCLCCHSNKYVGIDVGDIPGLFRDAATAASFQATISRAFLWCQTIAENNIGPSLTNIKDIWIKICRQTPNIGGTLVDNKIADHSDVIGALPVGAAPTTYSFLT